MRKGRKQHHLAEIGTILRTIDARTAAGDTVADVCHELGISAATYYLWRRDYGGMTSRQLEHLDKLNQTIAQLAKDVRHLTLDNAILKETLRLMGPLTATQKRRIVRLLQERLRVSQRRACAALSELRDTPRCEPSS